MYFSFSNQFLSIDVEDFRKIRLAENIESNDSMIDSALRACVIQHEFVNMMYDEIMKCDSVSAPISIIIAQAAIETGWGRKVHDNNYFNITTHKEIGRLRGDYNFVNGERIKIKQRFEMYDNVQEAVLRHSDIVAKVYSLKSDMDYNQALSNLVDGNKKYATDPLYKQKVGQIIEDFHLYLYDENQKLNEMLTSL